MSEANQANLEREIAGLKSTLQDEHNARKKAEEGIRIAEDSALEMLGVIADINREKEDTEAALSRLENSAMEIARSLGEINLEKIKAEESQRMFGKNVAKIIGDLIKQKQDAIEQRQTLEQSSMGLIASFGELNAEKEKAEKQMLTSSKQLAKIIGDLNKERERYRSEKEMLESSSLELIRNFAEINEEKQKVEESAMSLARAFGEAESEKAKAEAVSGKVVKNLAKIIGGLNIEKLRALEDKNRLEQTAMELINAFADINMEKTRVEETAMQLAQAFGELNAEKQTIEEGAMNLARTIGEITAEKDQVEKSAMDLARVIGELNAESESEKINILKKFKKDFEDTSDRRIKLEHGLQTMSRKFIPEGAGDNFLSGKQELNEKEITCVCVRFKFPAKSGRARRLKELNLAASRLAAYYDGWASFWSSNMALFLFGASKTNKAHALDACVFARQMRLEAAELKISSAFSVYSGTAEVGDIGSPLRPQFGAAGELLDSAEHTAAGALEKQAGKILLNADCAEEMKRYFHVTAAAKGAEKTFFLDDPLSIHENPYRVRAASAMARLLPPAEAFVEKVISRHFADVDLERLEIKDGSLGQGKTIAASALVLAKKSGIKINEDLLVRSAMLMHSGKLFIKREVLQKSSPNTGEKAFMKKLSDFSQRTASKLKKQDDAGALIAEAVLADAEIKTNEAKLLKLASRLESLVFSKNKSTLADFTGIKKKIAKEMPADLSEILAGLL